MPKAVQDAVLFAGSLWVEAHVVGEARRFFDGAEFCLSDHFGLLCYVDVHNAYSLRSKAGEMEARARRLRLVSLKDLAVQKELVESRALLQLGREEQALARKRAAPASLVNRSWWVITKKMVAPSDHRSSEKSTGLPDR